MNDTPSIVFAHCARQISSVDELLTAEDPVILYCLDPAVSCSPRVIDYGFPENPYNVDTAERISGRSSCAGWAVVALRRVYYLRDFFAVGLDGTVYLMNPRWRDGWMLDYFGEDVSEIHRRLSMTQSYNTSLSLVASHKLLPADKMVLTPAATLTGHVHGHWLFEQLIPLGLWEQIDFFPTIYTMWLKQYQHELLSLTSYPGKVVSAESPLLYFDRLLLPVPWADIGCQFAEINRTGWTLDKSRCVNQGGDMWWRGAHPNLLSSTRRLGERAKGFEAKADKIYVMRDKNSTHSICLNEDEVCRLASRHGFLIVDPSTLSGYDEASLFYNASVVMGSSGGGIENIIFSKTGVTVILISAADSSRTSVACVAAFAEMRLIRIRCPQFTAFDKWYLGGCSSYVADLHLLDTILCELKA